MHLEQNHRRPAPRQHSSTITSTIFAPTRSRRLHASATALLALAPVGMTTGFVPPATTTVRPTSSSSLSPSSSLLPSGVRSLAGGGGGSYRSTTDNNRPAVPSIAASLASSGLARVLAREGRSGSGDSTRRVRASGVALAASAGGGGGSRGNGNGSGERMDAKNSNRSRKVPTGANGYSVAGRTGGAAAGGGKSNVGGRQATRREGESRPWRTSGDIPGLVVGVGILATRHRREFRAEQEQQAVSNAPSAAAAAADRDEREHTPMVEIGLAGAGAGAGLGSTRAMMMVARRSGGERGDGGREGSGSACVEGDDKFGEAEEEEGARTEVEEETGVEQEDSRYRRADVGWRDNSPSEMRLEVSLDRSVMPEPISPFVVWGGGLFVWLTAIAVVARIPRMLGSIGSLLLGSTASGTMEQARRHSQMPAVVGNLRYSTRLWTGSMQGWAARRKEAWERAFGPEEVRLPAKDWSVCTLEERDRIGASVLRYRFRLEGGPNAVLPLELGQELTLCGLDPYNQVVHSSFVPLSPRQQRGYFDIVVKRDVGGQLDDGLGTTRSEKEFSRFLDNLPVGDEIAVKPGREGLVYTGPYSPITDVVLIATGLGVVPMIQLVKELLPSPNSSVRTASVVWLNERTEDFALYPELEKVFFRNHRKLDVSCIMERDLFGAQLASNADLNEAAPEFKIGTLAAVAGPEFFTRKVADFLIHKGYPEEVIVNL